MNFRTVAQVRRVAGGIHEPPESVDVIEDDPTDNRTLECALAADAEFVVAGYKKHLLPLGSFRGVSIVGLEGFLVAFPDDSGWRTRPGRNPPPRHKLSS